MSLLKVTDLVVSYGGIEALVHFKGDALQRFDAAVGNDQIRNFQQAHSSSTPR